MSDKQGAIPYQLLREMIEAGYIQGSAIEALQPASLDLTLTDEIYRMRGSYLPRLGESIQEILNRGALFRHDVIRPLEQNGIYLIKLAETLALPPGIHATSSNKSSSGRINLRGRLLADGVPRFDEIPARSSDERGSPTAAGYHGSLWLEVIPKSFPVLLHPGHRINQIRFFHGDAKLSSLEHRIAFDRFGLLRTIAGARIAPTVENVRRGITMTVDLTSQEIIGWRSKTTAWSVLDMGKYDHDPADFFEPVPRPKSGELVIHPEAFYILATKEKIITPPNFATEMAAYDSSKGEFRSHFAGFFDPGWGWRENDVERGTIAVLEVEAYSHDFVLRDGQPICLMVYDRMLAPPEKLYGEGIQSHYHTQQGPRLAKWFKV
ncbi:2'-deoxycytidine 5'-triphosphate deaminase [Candidatus Uhrbacteria bacterium]|nr:2'-deoxycytidine 5'-triphosphate deaminase [Candidatus Uhrbacteria bacterium]